MYLDNTYEQSVETPRAYTTLGLHVRHGHVLIECRLYIVDTRSHVYDARGLLIGPGTGDHK